MSQLGVCWSFLDIYSIKNEKDQINTTETETELRKLNGYLHGKLHTGSSPWTALLSEHGYTSNS